MISISKIIRSDLPEDKWSSDQQMERVIATLQYIVDLIGKRIGQTAIHPDFFKDQLPFGLKSWLSKYYTSVEHNRKYSNVDGLVDNSLALKTFSAADITVVKEIKLGAKNLYNKWVEIEIETVYLTGKRPGSTLLNEKSDLRTIVQDLAPISMGTSTLDGLSADEKLAIEAPRALEIAMETESKALADQGIIISEEDRARFADESDNKFSEIEYLNEKYPIMAWFLMRNGYNGIVKATQSEVAMKAADRDSAIRSDITAEVKEKGAVSVLESLINKFK